MSELTPSQVSLLRHIHSGGLVCVRVYGKRVQTVDVVCKPKSDGAGLKSISHLEELGLIYYGDPSPYKSGTSRPRVLTEAGKAALVEVAR